MVEQLGKAIDAIREIQESRRRLEQDGSDTTWRTAEISSTLLMEIARLASEQYCSLNGIPIKL